MIYIAVLNDLIVNGSARFLNKLYANDIDIGSDVVISGKTTTGQLVINGGTNFSNLSSGDSNGAPLVIGNPASRHIAIDADEIAGKNNATSRGHLWLNYGGGNVYLSTGQQIYANNGTFTTPTLRATNIGDNNNVVSTAFIATGNITTLNTNAISNAGAIVTRDMEVIDTLKSYKWDISHVANLANDFTVSPTLQLASGATIQFSAINTSTKVCTFTVTDSSSISSDSLGGVTWTQYSKVKFTMNLNDVVNSNCDGYLTVKMNSTAGTLVISGTLDDVTGLATGTNYNAEGATIMLYEVGAGSQSTTYPVGIRMTAYGSNKRSYIDIYGGTSTSSWTSPHVRIGNVGGLTFNGKTLGNQWGIYTDKGYFSGAIVSKEGNIGGFFIDQTNIHNNVTSLTDTSHTGIYLGTDGIRNYNTTGSKHVTIKDGTITANSVDLTGAIKATSGTIGGWNIGTDANKSLYYGGTTPSATNLVLSKGTVANSTSVGGSTGSLSWMILAGNKFGVTTGGVLYANSATISGAINATELNVGSASSSNHLIYNSTTGIIDLSTDWLKFNSNKTVMMGTGLTATSNQSISQMIIGNYNTLDNEAAFLIGGGSSASDTSNLFSITNIYDKNVTDTFVGDGSKTVFDLSNTKNGNPTLTIDGSSITISSHTNTSVTLSSAPSEGVVFTISYKTSSRKGYIILGNRSDTTNYGAYSITQGEPMVKATGLSTHAFGHVFRGNLIASGDGSLAHGYVSGSKVEASGRGSIIGGSFASSGTLADDFTNIKATQYGSAIQGFFDNTNVTSSGAGSFIVGYSTSGTITASGSGSFIVGDFGGNTSRIASGAGSFIHMHSINSSLTASGIGSSIHGHSYNSSITASNEGATISGYIFDNSTVTASGKGSFIGGYTHRSSKIASGDGSFIGGSTDISGEMTASGNGSCVIGYTNTTMTASGNGSIALNESTIATGRASLVIGSFNSSDTSSITTHPSNNSEYKQYAFIIGNGTSNGDRSNALTVDWNGNLAASGTITATNHQAGIVEAMAKTTTNANSGGVTVYWYYRKWSNNLVECWTTSSVSIAPTAANTKANRRITLPVTMPYKYSMQATIRGIPEITTCHIGLENINDNEIRLYIYESNTTPRSVDIYVIGSQ